VGKDSIIMIGMPASGKSTIGKFVATRLNWRFIDLDIRIREKAGRSIQELIDLGGEETLLQIEEDCMAEIELRRVVVAPGGSLVYHTELMERLQQTSLIVYLNEPMAELAKRLKNAASRGIVHLKGRSLAELYQEREPLYKRYADIAVNTAGLTRQQIAQEIIHLYEVMN
jgi:shikimate kinase